MAYKKVTGVYKILCRETGKPYVGSAVSIKSRWACHRHMLNKGTHSNKHLQNAFNKYGKDAFEFLVIEICEVDSLVVREQYWIDFYDAANSSVGMNNSPTASTTIGFKHSESTKKMLSEIASKRDHAHLRANAAAMKGTVGHSKGVSGRKWSDEEKAASSAARKGQKAWNKGITKSQKEKDAIAQTCRAKSLESRGLSRDVQEHIYTLRASGLSYPKIAEIVGVSIASCQRYSVLQGLALVGQGSRKALGAYRSFEKVKGVAR